MFKYFFFILLLLIFFLKWYKKKGNTKKSVIFIVMDLERKWYYVKIFKIITKNIIDVLMISFFRKIIIRIRFFLLSH